MFTQFLLTVPQYYNISPTSPQPVAAAILAALHANTKFDRVDSILELELLVLINQSVIKC